VRNKYGKSISKTALYKLLHNRTYLGEAVHKGSSYRGEHKAIVAQALWDSAHAVMAESPRKRSAHSRAQTPALLKGLLYGADGFLMSPTHTRRRGREYRYYIASGLLKNGDACGPVARVPAGEIERVVVEQIATLVRTPERCARRCMVSMSFGADSSLPSRRALSSCW
jgi:site-specific DNA recombinase